MAKPRKNISEIVQTHVDKLKEALKDEDLAEAFKWLFKLGKLPDDCKQYFKDLKELNSVPLYVDATKADRDSKGETDYCSELRNTQATLLGFEHIFEDRYN